MLSNTLKPILLDDSIERSKTAVIDVKARIAKGSGTKLSK
jgi:hypothetical protein